MALGSIVESEMQEMCQQSDNINNKFMRNTNYNTSYLLCSYSIDRCATFLSIDVDKISVNALF